MIIFDNRSTNVQMKKGGARLLILLLRNTGDNTTVKTGILNERGSKMTAAQNPEKKNTTCRICSKMYSAWL